MFFMIPKLTYQKNNSYNFRLLNSTKFESKYLFKSRCFRARDIYYHSYTDKALIFYLFDRT